MARHRYSGSYVWGTLFIVAGMWWLLHMLGVVPFRWDVFGPLALITVGVSMFVRGRWSCGCGWEAEREGNESS